MWTFRKLTPPRTNLLKNRGSRRNGRRAPFALLALRPNSSPGFKLEKKIRTLGVRAGFVGEFSVKDQEIPQTDIIAEGRAAWDSVLGTVTLGKFFLNFGAIGIAEHALQEAVAHLKSRILYNRPVLELPHINHLVCQAYARFEVAAVKIDDLLQRTSRMSRIATLQKALAD